MLKDNFRSFQSVLQLHLQEMWCQNAATMHSSVTCWLSFIARDLTHTQHTVSRKEYISGDRPPPTNNFET